MSSQEYTLTVQRMKFRSLRVLPERPS